MIPSGGAPQNLVFALSAKSWPAICERPSSSSIARISPARARVIGFLGAAVQLAASAVAR